MQKPIDLIVEDTKELIYSTLNNSGLPMSMITMIVRELSNGVETQYSNHLNKLRSEYQIQMEYEAQQQMQNDVDINNLDILENEVIE